MSMHNKSALRAGFIWDSELVLPSGEIITAMDRNMVPQVGINHLAELIRGNTAPISNWFIGVFEGNYVPDSSTTAADIPVNAQECVAYSEAARPNWEDTYDGVSVITSLSDRAEFTFTADKRLHGAFLVSQATKGSGGGLLLSIARFQTPYDVPAGGIFRLGASLTLLPEL